MKNNSSPEITRRSFMIDTVAVVAASQFAASAEPRPDKRSMSPRMGGHTVQPVVPPKTEPFSPAVIRLLEGPFKQSRDAAARYLLSLEIDRLLAPYRNESGLKEKAPQYPGWETENLPGVALAFYLSAISRMALNMDGWESEEFHRRLNYILDELEACQKLTGGYLLGTRNGKAIFARVENDGKFAEGFAQWEGAQWGQGSAEPYYALEKIFSGLRDAYRIAGLPKALNIEIRLGNWLDGIMSHLSDAQMADLMTVEFGGMNWVLSDLYADTGDPRFMALSRRWQDHALFDDLAAGKDNLSGLHANTQFPKISGLAARYPYSNDPTDLRTARLFWERVVRHHSYATGGNSHHEHFGPPDQLNDELSQYSEENCNEWNMLRLTQLLFDIEPRPEYAEYIERTLFNHILSAQDPRDARVCYFLPLKSGCSRAPETLYHTFSCCVCSGFDSYSRTSDYIYSHSADGLYVKLFAASEVSWKEKGLTLRQETNFPDEDFSTFKFSLRQPTRLTLHLRYPLWAVNEVTVQVNGVAQPVNAKRGEFFAVDREWRDGDNVILKMPFVVRHETMPDNKDRIAFFAGPILLAGDLGPIADPRIDDPGHVPLLVADNESPNDWLQATGAPLTFVTTVARPRQFALKPFFRQRDCSYAVYWDRVTPSGWAAHLNDVKQLRVQDQQIELRTVDKVIAGDLASETAHHFVAEGDSEVGRGMRGYAMHLSWRSGVSIAYQMKIPQSQPVAIRCRCFPFWPSTPKFEVQVDGTRIGQEQLPPSYDGIAVEYRIPPELSKGKDTIRVVIHSEGEAHDGLRITEVRVLSLAT
jgi:uncharacterized protein